MNLSSNILSFEFIALVIAIAFCAFSLCCNIFFSFLIFFDIIAALEIAIFSASFFSLSDSPSNTGDFCDIDVFGSFNPSCGFSASGISEVFDPGFSPGSPGFSSDCVSLVVIVVFNVSDVFNASGDIFFEFVVAAVEIAILSPLL